MWHSSLVREKSEFWELVGPSATPKYHILKFKLNGKCWNLSAKRQVDHWNLSGNADINQNFEILVLKWESTKMSKI